MLSSSSFEMSEMYYVGSKCLNPITDSAPYHNVTDSSTAPPLKYRNGEAMNLRILGEHWAEMDVFFHAI